MAKQSPMSQVALRSTSLYSLPAPQPFQFLSMLRAFKWILMPSYSQLAFFFFSLDVHHPPLLLHLLCRTTMMVNKTRISKEGSVHHKTPCLVAKCVTNGSQDTYQMVMATCTKPWQCIWVKQITLTAKALHFTQFSFLVGARFHRNLAKTAKCVLDCTHRILTRLRHPWSNNNKKIQMRYLARDTRSTIATCSEFNGWEYNSSPSRITTIHSAIIT